MLTGDKGLTAKEIGVSCGLLPESKKSNEDVTKNISEPEEEQKGNLICEFEESTNNAGTLEKETDALTFVHREVKALRVLPDHDLW